MARTKQTARRSTSGKAPRKQSSEKSVRWSSVLDACATKKHSIPQRHFEDFVDNKRNLLRDIKRKYEMILESVNSNDRCSFGVFEAFQTEDEASSKSVFQM